MLGASLRGRGDPEQGRRRREGALNTELCALHLLPASVQPAEILLKEDLFSEALSAPLGNQSSGKNQPQS